MQEIDINCDMGEGVGNEARLMPFIGSCNISCGAHAGTEDEIRHTIGLALRYKVKIGAHPSYPDKENFGRKVLHIPIEELQHSIRCQLDYFSSILKGETGRLHHIKPHGALYNQLALDTDLSIAFLKAISPFKSCFLYVPYGSRIADEAKKKGFKIVYEAFADRNYTDNLNLVARTQKNALIQSPLAVLRHVIRMAKERKVLTINGNLKRIRANTFCIHGDTPNALKILQYLDQNLPNHQLCLAQ